MLSNISRLDLISLLQLSFTDTILINNTSFTQTHGLPMGNSLSPILAILYMDSVERQFCHNNPRILYWRRYVDDCFCIATQPISSLITEINTLNQNIKFTCEEPTNNSMPFLDVMVKLTSDRHFFTCLFTKECHSNYILPWQSGFPIQMNFAFLRTEYIRIKRICNTTDALNYSKTYLSKRMVANGYPSDIVNAHLSERILPFQTEPRKKIIYLHFPFINEWACTQIHKLLKRHTSEMQVTIRPIFKSQPNLAVQLSRKLKIPCGNGCICNGRNICNLKNLVYKI